MSSFGFSFAGALWALPLASAPILLHLLFKQKSPVVQFSTLRFIKLSIQRTAARRRVQKWLLLACRTLLLALLIWAIAQPVQKLTGSWMGGGSGRSVVAAIVIDTSYSMQLQDGQVTLLSKAESMTQDLLRNQLADAKVAIFKSLPNSASGKGQPEQLRDASAILAEWSPLKPQPSLKPLADRIAAAVALLDRQPAEEKWLVVISDFQLKEFPQQLPEVKDGRTVLLDLHPADARSAGVTKVTLSPAQPIPGIPSEATVQITGQPGDNRQVKLLLSTPDGNAISESAVASATLDSTGRATRQFPVKLPAERWIVMTGALTADDAMQWDNQRSRLIEVPPKQIVGVLQQSAGSLPEKLVRLVLDPSEGKLTEWPLSVRTVTTPGVKDNVIAAVLSRWPGVQQAAALRRFAEAGHSVILFLAPGLENSWGALPADERDSLLALLPSAPIQRPGDSLCRVAVANANDPLLQGLTDDKYQINSIVVRALVPLAAAGDSSTILNAVPADPVSGSRTQGLLYRKPVGRGVCFTFATLPDPRMTTLATHPTFLPLMVRMSLRTAEQSAGQNVELGHPLVLDGSVAAPEIDQLQIESPQHEQYRVHATPIGEGRQFVFGNATEPGLYTWRAVNNPATVAMTNVMLPGSESELTYRPAQSVASGSDTVIATSIADLTGKITELTAPQPQWSTPLAIVMFLLCLEALMGSWSKVWKAPTTRAFVPGGVQPETAG
jgi:hypothetical protein